MEKSLSRLKGHPPTRATLNEPTFQAFPYKHDEPFTLFTRDAKSWLSQNSQFTGLYFLFKVRRARVINDKPQRVYRQRREK